MSTIQQIHHRLKIGVVINITLRIIMMLHFCDFIGLEPKQEEILFTYMFEYFDVGTVKGADSQRTVHHELHVTGTRGFLTCG